MFLNVPKKYVSCVLAVWGLCLVFGFQNCAGSFNASISNLSAVSAASTNLGTDAGNNKSVTCGIPDVAAIYLSETCFGKYQARLEAGEALENFVEFEPQYPLYSDGAVKRRWVYLPPGTKVNTAEADSWKFPKGSILYKQFIVDGKLIETRQAEKVGAGDGFSNWRYNSYANLEDDSDGVLTQSDFNTQPAEAMEYYAANRIKSAYVVGTPNTCIKCHESAADSVRGFSYLQLSSNKLKLPLNKAGQSGLISHMPTNYDEIPGGDLDKKVIGYIQSNCATCHNGSPTATAPGDFRHHSSAQTLSDEGLIRRAKARPGLIENGKPAKSLIYIRLGAGTMPPAWTHKTIDTDMASVFAEWITNLNLEETQAPPNPLANFTSISTYILNAKCIGCHNAGATPAAGINLTSYASLLASNVIVPGNSAQSRLATAIQRPGTNFMPMGGARLSDEEIAAIKEWIDKGAANN